MWAGKTGWKRDWKLSGHAWQVTSNQRCTQGVSTKIHIVQYLRQIPWWWHSQICWWLKLSALTNGKASMQRPLYKLEIWANRHLMMLNKETWSAPGWEAPHWGAILVKRSWGLRRAEGQMCQFGKGPVKHCWDHQRPGATWEGLRELSLFNLIKGRLRAAGTGWLYRN